MQPAGHGVALGNSARLPGQDQEGGLASIFRVLNLFENPPAHAEHHAAVSPHQGSEGCPFLTLKEALQQLPVAQGFERPVVLPLPQLTENPTQWHRRHDRPSWWLEVCL
jgi:hypothetical protein